MSVEAPQNRSLLQRFAHAAAGELDVQARVNLIHGLTVTTAQGIIAQSQRGPTEIEKSPHYDYANPFNSLTGLDVFAKRTSKLQYVSGVAENDFGLDAMYIQLAETTRADYAIKRMPFHMGRLAVDGEARSVSGRLRIDRFAADRSGLRGPVRMADYTREGLSISTVIGSIDVESPPEVGRLVNFICVLSEVTVANPSLDIAEQPDVQVLARI